MEKKLIIIDKEIKSQNFLKQIEGSIEVLALNSIAMHSLKEFGIPFKNVDNFYGKHEFINDCKKMFSDTEKIFKKLDTSCESFFEFPHAFSGNICFFLHVLCELLYIEILCNRIRKSYKKIFVLEKKISKFKGWEKLDIINLRTNPNSLSLSFQKPISGINSKIIIMQACLETISLDSKSSSSEKKTQLIKLKNFFYKFVFIFKNYLKYFLKKLDNFILNLSIFFHPKKPILVYAQGGYSVSRIIKSFTEVIFLDFTTQIRKVIEEKPPIKYNFEDGLKIITPYLENYWPRLKPYIETLFISYNREIVGRLSSFIYLVLKSIESYNPRIFLYSSGTRDVLDCVTAYIANQKNIPVIYFQHGGAQTFQYSIFQKYVENDEKIIKTLIMDSKLEQQQIKNYGSISKAYGSPLVYNFIHNGENTVKKDILYLSSPFPSSTFRSVINGNTEINFYKTSNDILEVIHNFKLNLDIKIHPVELDKQYQYYSNIISENDFVYFKIIKSLRAETILKNYSLIILDMVGTTLLSYVLALKTPIIIYLKDISIINNISKKDLYERCYIIDNKYDFNKLISSHANNELPSKWSEQMIDRYIYPIEKGDPSKNVVCYMKNLLKKD